MSSVPTKTPLQEKNYLPEKDRLVMISSVSPWIPRALHRTVAIDGILPVQESDQIHDDEELVIGKY